MSRRQQWYRALDAEMAKWSGRSSEELIAALDQRKIYEIRFESKTFQVEVEILENTDRYVHVSICVDDGMLPWAIVPATRSFVCSKPMTA